MVQTGGSSPGAGSSSLTLIAMTPETFLVRQEHVQNLGRFSQSLAESLEQFAFGPEKLSSALRMGIVAECVQCGIRVTGEELLDLSQPGRAPANNPKVERLRQGYCARNGCDSYYYRLHFLAYPDIDWATVLSRAESVTEQRVHQVEARDASNEATNRAALWRLVSRVGIGLAAVALLLLVRQWYLGGRIPFLREPENFQVDHFPSDRQLPQ